MGLAERFVLAYLRDQADDLKAWMRLGLREKKPRTLQEFADVLYEALENVLDHGSPPKGD